MARDKRLIIGNWKMNLDVHGSSLYLHSLSKKIRPRRDVEVIIAPTMLALQTLSVQVNLRQFKLAAQNFYWRDHGAFTGEVSAPMLKSCGSANRPQRPAPSWPRPAQSRTGREN